VVNYLLSPDYFIMTELGHRLTDGAGSAILIYDIPAALLDDDDANIVRKPSRPKIRPDYSIYNNPGPRKQPEALADGEIGEGWPEIESLSGPELAEAPEPPPSETLHSQPVNVAALLPAEHLNLLAKSWAHAVYQPKVEPIFQLPPQRVNQHADSAFSSIVHMALNAPKRETFQPWTLRGALWAHEWGKIVGHVKKSGRRK